MHKKSKYSCCLIFAINLFCLLKIGSLWALNTKFLEKNVADNGSIFSDSDLTSVSRSTVEAVFTLRLLGNVDPSIQANALKYLESFKLESLETESLSAITFHKIRQGVPVATELDEILSRQNQDGGFGSHEGYDSSVFDTAVALYAISQVSQDQMAEAAAIQYLLDRQDKSGAYSVYDSNESSIPVTSLVYTALQPYRFKYKDIPDALREIGYYLLENPPVDSGLDGVWKKSIALLAIIPEIRDSRLYSTQVNELKASQLSDGSWGGDVFVTALSLRALHLASNITFPEEPTAGTFSGRVFSVNQNLPLSDVVVSVKGQEDRASRTDDKGYFVVKNVEPGKHEIVYSTAGYQAVKQTAEVTKSQVVNLGFVRLQAAPNVVVITGEILITNSEVPISGATLSLVDEKGEVKYTIISDSSGQYQAELEPGKYKIKVTVPGYREVFVDADLEAGKKMLFSPSLVKQGEPEDIKLSVAGVVVDSDSGQVIEGVRVEVQSSTASVLTDGDGRFALDDLEAGKITLVVSKGGYQERSLEFIASAGNKVNVGNVLLVKKSEGVDDNSSLFGKVIDAVSGLPIQNATIAVDGSDQSTKTLSDGTYTLDEVKDLKFKLLVSASGYWSQLPEVDMDAHGRLQFNVSLSPSDLGGLSVTELGAGSSDFSAYEPISITATIKNAGDVPKTAQLYIEVLDSADRVLFATPVGSMAGGIGPGDPIVILPEKSVSVDANWFTANKPAGRYRIKLSAYDKFTKQLLSEKYSTITIVETSALAQVNLRLNKAFTHVGATERVLLMADVINRSNQPSDFTFKTIWRDAGTDIIKESDTVLSLLGSDTEKSIDLLDMEYSFKESGRYPFTVELSDSQLSPEIQEISVEVAPTVRVEAEQSISEKVITPDGDRKITIEVKIKGVEQ
ncbi:carboxypeptidase regulatory-like domain-containing protein [Endozoicomonas sp. ALB091]|uniref:carboxypeptidase regulatory-like domain-containing protein n=1 Tax=Endozoicomonas sp. ALB091 TaxID=3403073 RepID=UPI003BB6661E